MASKARSVESIGELFCIPLSDGRYGGYKLEILKQNLSAIEERFVVCPSCKGIMKNASFSAGKNMCECCFPESEQTAPVESVRETVNKLPCGCPLDSKGCAWSGVIGELETHLCVCEHLMVPCPFVEYGCEIGLVRRLEMQLHLKEFSTQHLLGRIVRVEEENRKAFSEIDFLKKENQRAFGEINFLKKENFGLKEILSKKWGEEIKSQIEFQVINVTKTIKYNVLDGFQFTLPGIDALKSLKGVNQGPLLYLERCKIQISYELNPLFHLSLMRIPGKHANESGKIRVGALHYHLINNMDSSVMYQYKGTNSYPLIVNQICPKTDGVSLDEFDISNDLTIWFCVELEFGC